ncbi:MAG: dual specificity protein phosphatase family protein [Candidatus Acidiferrales bacterium]
MKAWFVTKRLAFGSAITTWSHVEKLQALGVTHVVSLRHGKHGTKVRQFKCLWLPFRDDKMARPKRFYRHALRFYVKAMREPDSKVFVMCHRGICRSASLTYFFLRVSGNTPNQSKALVHKARPSAVIAREYRNSCEAFLFLEDLGEWQ